MIVNDRPHRHVRIDDILVFNAEAGTQHPDTSRPPVHDAQPAARVSTYRCVSRSGCVSIAAGGAPPKRDPCPAAGNEGDKKTGMIPAYGCAGSCQAYPLRVRSTARGEGACGHG